MKKLVKKQMGGGSKAKKKDSFEKLDKAMKTLKSIGYVSPKEKAAKAAADSTRKARLDSIYKADPEYFFRKKGGAVKSKKK